MVNYIVRRLLQTVILLFVVTLAVFVLIWFGYVISVGGDFMEFRFMVPVIPFIMIVVIKALVEFIKDKRILTALILALCLGTFNHFHFMSKVFFSYHVERVEQLRDHVYAPGENWVAIGKKLGVLFEGTDVTLGIGAAGVIPYYSKLRSVDFMGLNDKVIPKIGESFSSMPGHRLIAPLEYLVNRDVNLVIQPIQLMIPEHQFFKWRRLANWQDIGRFFLDIDKPVNGAIMNEVQLICIPIEPKHYLVTWYLNPHEAVDRAIREHGLIRIKLVR